MPSVNTSRHYTGEYKSPERWERVSVLRSIASDEMHYLEDPNLIQDLLRIPLGARNVQVIQREDKQRGSLWSNFIIGVTFEVQVKMLYDGTPYSPTSFFVSDLPRNPYVTDKQHEDLVDAALDDWKKGLPPAMQRFLGAPNYPRDSYSFSVQEQFVADELMKARAQDITKFFRRFAGLTKAQAEIFFTLLPDWTGTLLACVHASRSV